MDTMQSSAALFVVPTPSPHSLTPLDASSTRYTSLSGSSSGDLQAGFLVLVPVALVVFIVVALLGAYKWQQGRESSEGSLCQSWRRRIYRRTSSPRHPVAVRGRITTTQGGDSTVMLVEELTDIDADVWDAHLYGDDTRQDPISEQVAHSFSTSSSSKSDSETYLCTVEVHSDPFFAEIDPTPESPVQTQVCLSVTTSTADEDVSTQALDLSQSNITSPSYYSAQSTSEPSLTSRNTLHSSGTFTSTSLSGTDKGDLAQEIVDVVQSEGFVEDTAGVLRCGSSQLCLFNSGCDIRGGPNDDTGDLTPMRVEGFSSSTPVTSTVADTRAAQEEPEQIVIPLTELDSHFGSSIMWEDWDQELQTML